MLHAEAAPAYGILAPGDIRKCLLPVLFVEGMGEAIARSRARVVLVMNLMTEPRA